MIIPLTAWAEQNVVLDDGSFIRFEPHQKKILNRAFQFNEQGILKYQTMLLSMIKKSGKTEILGNVGAWMAFEVEPGGEVICCANDEEQSVGRVFRVIKRVVEKNPVLMSRVDNITKSEIALKDGGTIKAIASEYAGAAGANPTCTLWDELWAYTSERSRRLWDELTPVPTRKNSVRAIGTYAGFLNESELLLSLYERGKRGKRLWTVLPCWENQNLFMLWDTKPRMRWQTKSYYQAQRGDLRPIAYRRMHENQWVSAENAFISPEMWDAITDNDHAPPLPSKEIYLFVGCDASTKRDRSAVVSCYRKGDKIYLGPKRYWTPSPNSPIDLERTMEDYILELSEQYKLISVRFDPYQMHRSSMTLQEKGVPMVETPQTVTNLTDIGSNLFDLIQHRNLVVYKDKVLREEALNCVGKERERGVSITKEKSRHKIDQIVSLAMAALDAAKSEEMTEGEIGYYGHSLAVGTPRLSHGTNPFQELF